MSKLANLPTLENLWGVVYFEEDGSVLCADFLEAADYFDAADQALDEADGDEFQLVEGIDIVGPSAPKGNRELFGPAIYLLLLDLMSRPCAIGAGANASV